MALKIHWEKTSRAQIATKKNVKKYRNLVKKKPYQTPPPNTFGDIADLETVDDNNDTSISDWNDIVFELKKNKNAQIVANKIVQKYKKLAKKKAPVTFNISDAADTEAVDYNKDTNINNVLSSKSAQIATEKILNRYDNLRRKRKRTLDISELDVAPSSKNKRASSSNNRNKIA